MTLDPATAAELHRLRDVAGYSWREVARSLEARAYPTTSGSGQWHAASARAAWTTSTRPRPRRPRPR